MSRSTKDKRVGDTREETVDYEQIGDTFYLYVDPKRARRRNIPSYMPFTIGIVLAIYAFSPFFLMLLEAALFPYFTGESLRELDDVKLFMYYYAPRIVSSLFALFIAVVLGHAGITMWMEAS